MLSLLDLFSQILDPIKLTTVKWAVECKAFSLLIPVLQAVSVSLISAAWRKAHTICNFFQLWVFKLLQECSLSGMWCCVTSQKNRDLFLVSSKFVMLVFNMGTGSPNCGARSTNFPIFLCQLSLKYLFYHLVYMTFMLLLPFAVKLSLVHSIVSEKLIIYFLLMTDTQNGNRNITSETEKRHEV
jgi:hypothetical protein